MNDLADAHLPITRCPHCKTAFRVRESQIAQRRGMVRCGACRGVFNAIQHLLHQKGNTITVEDAPESNHPTVQVYEDSPAQLNPLTLMPEGMRAASVPKSAPETKDVNEPGHSVFAPESMAFVHGDAPTAQPSAARSGTPVSETTGSAESGFATSASAIVAASVAATAAAAASSIAAPAVAPSRSAAPATTPPATTAPEIAAKPILGPIEPEQEIYTDELEARLEGKPKPSAYSDDFEWKGAKTVRRAAHPAWTVAAVALLLLLFAQSAMVFRNELAVRFPVLRPYLETLCAPLHCVIAPPERPTSLAIEGAEFQSDPSHSGLYTFSATLRNRHERAAGFPYLVVTLTGVNSQVLTRRYFSPKEYLPGNADLNRGLAGNSEIEFKLFLETVGITPVGFDVRYSYAPAA